MIRTRLIIISIVTLLSALSVNAHTPPDHARVFFVNIKDGDVVSNPVKIVFGIKGFGITTAGDNAKNKHNAGHHHLLIDLDKLPDLEEPLPVNRNIIHYDNGETEATIRLPKGKHTLQMLLADEDHEPHDPPLYSKKITITVR